jgi:predicted DCC family thiol-disulfide oxidoreductase YuxK
VAQPTPLLVFDGDCAFCTTWVRRLERWLPDVPEAQPWQWVDHEALGLSRHDVTHYVWLLTDSRRFRGHAAVAALLRRQRPAGWRFLGHLLVTPPFSWAAAVGYLLVARFRHRLPGGTPACALEHEAEAISGLRRDASADARLGRRDTQE